MDKEESEEDLLLLTNLQNQNSSGENSQYDEDELRALAKSLAPNVCDLLSDEAFDNLLREEEDEELWRDAPLLSSPHGKMNANISGKQHFSSGPNNRMSVDKDEEGSDDDDDDDGFNNELSRLSDLEDTLREELELANGGFGGFFTTQGEDEDNSEYGEEFEYEAARDAETNLLDKEEEEEEDEEEEEGGEILKRRDSKILVACQSTSSSRKMEKKKLKKRVLYYPKSYQPAELPDMEKEEDYVTSLEYKNEENNIGKEESESENTDFCNFTHIDEHNLTSSYSPAAPTSSPQISPKKTTPAKISSSRKKSKKEKRKKYQPITPETHNLQSDLASSPKTQDEDSIPSPIKESTIAEAVAAALSTPLTPNPSTEKVQKEPKYYSLLDHFRSLGGTKDSNVDYNYETCPLFDSTTLLQYPILTLPSSPQRDAKVANEILNSIREYVRPPCSKDLNKMFIGLNAPTLHAAAATTAAQSSSKDVVMNRKKRENLPVRTLAIRIRPDVLCGATMDGLTSVVMNLGGEMTKRQGGHLRAVLPGISFEKEGGLDNEDEETMEEMQSSFSTLFSSAQPMKKEEKKRFLPPLLIDAQLCTKKHTKECERILLIRAYRIDASIQEKEGEEKEGEEFDDITIAEEELEAIPAPIVEKEVELKEESREGCEILFETAALVQRIHLRGLKGGGTYYQFENDVKEEKTPVTPPMQQASKVEFDGGYTEQQAGDTTAESAVPDTAPVTEESTSYARSFGNFLSSPLRLFGSSSTTPTTVPTPTTAPASAKKIRRGRGRLHSSKHHTSNDEYDVDIDISTLLFPNVAAAKQAVSNDLLAHYSDSRSVQDFIFTTSSSKHYHDGEEHTSSDTARRKEKEARMMLMPILSNEDYPFIQSAWRFVKGCLGELDDRDLLYSTLATSSFGSFPALPTLDVHYCSQIRLLCRENMIKCLLKAASELEQYARESEFSCANLIQLLRPTFELYEMNPPVLPKPVPLTAYPLEFTPPEASCPPWGLRVMEALNLIASQSNIDKSAVFGNDQQSKEIDVSTKEGERMRSGVLEDSNVTSQSHDASSGIVHPPKSGFQAAREAASLVVSAFQRQDDEEQAARLGRKNVQVMDRLAKMQAHKRESIITVRDSYGCNLSATKAADEFHSKAQSVVDLPKFQDVDNLQSSMDDFSPIVSGRKKEVPSPSSSLLPFYAASDQVPLLKCGILLGGATGTCYVTAHQILFVTQLIPILGGNRIHLVSISNVELVVQKPSSSILNPLPAGISVRISRNGEENEILSFIPSLGAHRFKSFIEVVQAVGTEDPETLKFSARGGLLYMFEESQSMQKRAAYVSSKGEDDQLEESSGQAESEHEDRDRNQISDPERSSV